MMKKASCLPFFLLWISYSSSIAEEGEEDPCKDGFCPTPPPEDDEKHHCDLWLAPSPIKQKEEHGFGLGMFTGRPIPKGQAVEFMYSGGNGEILLPLYGSTTIQDYPPIRDYLWHSSELPEVDMNGGDFESFFFVPGLSAMAPCTSQNYNVEWSGTGRASTPKYATAETNTLGIHRSRHATAGSFSYRNNVTYVAVRDIVPGEELVVRCSDDSFDGGAYYLSRFGANKDDDAPPPVCLDQNVRVQASSMIVEGTARSQPIGHGLFAKKSLKKDSVVISTPLFPIHRKELKIRISNDGIGGVDMYHQQQLLLNYAYGHPRSNLLLLPFGPLVNYINHHSDDANVAIQWHESSAATTSGDRQEYHHSELFKLSGEKVSKTHGKGLMMDFVALRDIKEGEELLLDYGPEWREAWGEHQSTYEQKQHQETNYMSAQDYAEIYNTNDNEAPIIRTLEDDDVPYPDNISTECFYHGLRKQDYKAFEGDQIIYGSWEDHSSHFCFLPCQVLTRDDETNTYTVRFSASDNYLEIPKCRLKHGVQALELSDVPYDGIRVVDKPFTTDMFLNSAFRHEIGVPENFYPEQWMKKKLRHKGQEKEEKDRTFTRKTNKSTREESIGLEELLANVVEKHDEKGISEESVSSATEE